jgi:poly-D-alanine transfer protein DltD
MSARVVALEKPELNQFIKTAKGNGEVLYVVVTPDYTGAGSDRRREIVQQVRTIGQSKGYRRITFFDAEGKTVAYASADRIDVQ